MFTSVQVVHAHGQLSTYLAWKGMQQKVDLTAAWSIDGKRKYVNTELYGK